MKKTKDDFFDDEDEISPFDDINDDADEIIVGSLKHIKLIISLFFSNREMYCGGMIPEYLLHSNRYIKNIKILISDAVDCVYRAMGTLIIPTDEDDISDKWEHQEDVKTVLKVLKMCSNEGVPKDMAGGILIMYMELCEGLRIKI